MYTVHCTVLLGKLFTARHVENLSTTTKKKFEPFTQT